MKNLKEYPTRCGQVNKHLALLDSPYNKFKLIRCNAGYFYLYSDNVTTGGIYTYRISNFTIEQWIDECKEAINNVNNCSF